MKSRILKHADLPVQTTWRSTPASAAADRTSPEEWLGAVERHAMVRLSSIDSREEFLAIAEAFGRPVPQYGQDIVRTIRARPGAGDSYGALNMNELKPHTEAYEVAGMPHRFQALRCVRSGWDSGGLTYICDFRPFIEEVLTAAERELLRTRRVRFVSTPGLRAEGIDFEAVHAILSDVDSGGRFILRFSLTCMEYGADPDLTRIVGKAARFHADHGVAVRWSEGDVVVWDNHRCVHSRSAYQDPNRQLERLWIFERS